MMLLCVTFLVSPNSHTKCIILHYLGNLPFELIGFRVVIVVFVNFQTGAIEKLVNWYNTSYNNQTFWKLEDGLI